MTHFPGIETGPLLPLPDEPAGPALWVNQPPELHGFPPAALPDEDPVERFLRVNRCCGAPQLCGARCQDDLESADAAAAAREIDRLREIVPVTGDMR